MKYILQINFKVKNIKYFTVDFISSFKIQHYYHCNNYNVFF